MKQGVMIPSETLYSAVDSLGIKFRALYGYGTLVESDLIQAVVSQWLDDLEEEQSKRKLIKEIMSDPIKRFPFWLHVAEFAAMNRLAHTTADKDYRNTALCRDDQAHLTNVVQRLLNAFAGVPIGPAEGGTEGVTNSPGADLRSADPASKP